MDARRDPEGRIPPRIIGHRGVRRDGIDENAMPAFEAALADGAEAVELDARTTATGELVVTHDPTLERVTAGRDTRAIAEVSWDELARVRLANGASIPTVREVLGFARANRLGVNVEMKHDVPSMAEVVRATARLLASWDRAHWLLVSSFHPAMLAGLAALAPHVARASLVHKTNYHLVHLATAFPLRSTAIHLDRTLTRPALVQWLRRRGFEVNVWTVNDAGEARELAALGVTGLITDRPGELYAALQA